MADSGGRPAVEPPDLAALAHDVVSDLEDVSAARDPRVSSDAGDATDYMRAGRPFARVARNVIEVRLPADIARAAMRTPDAGPSSLGQGWVRFSPRSTEPHVMDRARAWLITAWRHTAGQR